MKNVSLIITNTMAPNYIPLAHPMQQPVPVVSPFIPPKVYTVSFSAQFDEEAWAIKFAAELLDKVAGDGE